MSNLGTGNKGLEVDHLQYGAPVPEPSTFIAWSLLGALALTVGWWRRKRGR